MNTARAGAASADTEPYSTAPHSTAPRRPAAGGGPADTTNPGAGSPGTPAPDPAVQETVLVADTVDDVPAELPPGLVVVLPGGLRMRSGTMPAPPSPPPAPDVAPPQVVPPDAAATRARAAELTRLVVEVLTGRRVPEQLGGLAAPPVLRYLGAARAGAVARPTLTTAGRGGRAGAPGCSTTPPPRPARVHIMQPHPDAAEVCATPTIAGRPRAVVLRLDRRSGDAPWTVTAVRLL